MNDRATPTEVLQKAHDLVTVLFEATAALVVVLDTQGRIVRFNQACEQMTGYSLSEVEGKHLWDVLLIPEEVAAVKAVFKKLLAGQLPSHHQNFWRAKDSSLHLITWSNTLVTAPSGVVEYIIASGIDITEHKKAEVLLQKYQAKLEELVQERATQLTENNVKLSQEITERKQTSEELHNTREDLKKRVVEHTAELRKTNQSLRREIAQRKRAEKALRGKEARLRAIANAVPDVLLMLDEEGRYIEILTSQPQLLYTNPASIKGKLLREVLPEPLAERFLNAIEQTLATCQPQVVDYELCIARVGRRYFEARTAPLESLGEAKQAVVVVARDITQRKVTEEKLRQAEKMEAMGQLTGGVAHDFNNLLAIVLGNLELLEEQLAGQPGLQDLVRRALNAADRGADLTRRLLAFSRRQPLQPKQTDLNKLVLGMTDLLRRTLGETIHVETLLADNLLATLVDPAQLEIALLNLVLNARDALPNGGKLTIETANRWLEEDYSRTQLYYIRTGHYVMLAVSDTGTGMTPDVLERVFEPFFTTKEVGKGSGLGLSMVYGLVKQSGGHVNIYSEANKGTTVRIYLPCASPADTSAQQDKTAELVLPQGRSETILVVEDDAHVRQLAVNMLNNLGYRTIEAGTAKAALKILDEQPQIALLFTDVVLPGGMDGVDLAQEARRRRAGLKVLFTSGYAENTRIENCQLEEGVELLAKPYRKNSLANKLYALLGDG